MRQKGLKMLEKSLSGLLTSYKRVKFKHGYPKQESYRTWKF